MSDTKYFSEFPHRRFNQLNGEWILVSPHRTKRPWQGKHEKFQSGKEISYDSDCYLCPGNERAGGLFNPNYDSTYVFTNDFAALLPDNPIDSSSQNSLLKVDGIKGTCRVICFSPNHNLTLPRMSVSDIVKVIDVWAEQNEELGKKYQWIQIFENKGELMGCSNPHPHGQIWAGSSLPTEPRKEDEHQLKYFKKHDSHLLLDYLLEEKKIGERIVLENDDWIFAVPFWAFWPFETILIPKRHVLRINDLSSHERNSLADILKKLLTKYDNLFSTSFPYSMGWHGAPFNLSENLHWQLHAHFYPPLLRSASVKKFMVGYELLSEVQRDISAEQAAKKLREASHNFR